MISPSLINWMFDAVDHANHAIHPAELVGAAVILKTRYLYSVLLCPGAPMQKLIYFCNFWMERVRHCNGTLLSQRTHVVLEKAGVTFSLQVDPLTQLFERRGGIFLFVEVWKVMAQTEIKSTHIRGGLEKWRTVVCILIPQFQVWGQTRPSTLCESCPFFLKYLTLGKYLVLEGKTKKERYENT